MVRAREDQAGTSVRCWGCGNEVRVPDSILGGRLAGSYAKALRELLSPTHYFTAVGMGVVMSALLCVPRAGILLGVAFALVMSWYYQDNMERAGLDYAGMGDEIERLRLVDRVLRVLLGALGLCALFAPLYFRNWGHLLPGERTVPIERSLMFASFSLWLIAPLILLSFNARDARGRLAPWSVVGLLARHPIATLVSLLMLPVGFATIEFCTAIASWYEGIMPLMVADLFPTPTVSYVNMVGRELHFFYDQLHPVDRPVSYLIQNAFPDYLRAVSRGFFLTGTIPESLPLGSAYRFDPSFFETQPITYFWFRFVFAALIIAAAGFVLAVQSVWLGLIVAIGSSRKAITGTALAIHTPVEPPRILGESHAAVEPAIPSAWTGLLLHPHVDASEHAPRTAPPSPSAAVAAAAPESNGSQNAAHVQTRRTILIVDDERSFAHAIGRILADRGYAVLVAGEAEEGMRQARAARPDLIVLDLVLPDRPGIQLCRQIRADDHTRHTPIIVATYKNEAAEEVSALEAGADDFVGKPYVIEVMIARIERLLHRRQPLANTHV